MVTATVQPQRKPAAKPVHHSSVEGWHPKHNPWLIALTVTLATFMEVLDTSIANVALPHMAGTLGASQEEATWVLTSYLVVERHRSAYLRLAFYPIWPQAFLHDLRGAVYHLLAALRPRPHPPFLILARILQGLGGGGLAPSEQAILADTFPVEQRGQAFALYGMAVVAAPAIGPTLGGWITDNFNWHWIFFINLPIGIISLLLSNRMVEDPPYLVKERAKANPIDKMGLGLVAVGVGCLEFVLDKGQEKDWFGDRTITLRFCWPWSTLAFFVWWEWRHPDPIVDLKLLKNRNFGTAVGFQFILGSVLFSTTVLIPQFLQGLMGYTAERAGMALSAGALVLMVMMPVAGKLVSMMDARLMVSIGFLATSLALYNMTRLDLNVSFGHIVLWRVFQVLGLSFIFIPISTLNYVGVPAGKNNQISSFSNFARNFGGSMGTALLTTFLIRTQQTHQSALAANFIPGSVGYENFLAQTRNALMAAGQSAAQAKAAATGYAYQQLLRQSSMLSYQNAFWVLSVVAAMLVPWPFVMRRPPKRKKQAAEAVGH